MLTAFDKNILAINQIAIDVGRMYNLLPVIDSSLTLRMTHGETHDDTMHVGLLVGLAIPDEGPPSEVDMDTGFHQRPP